MVSSGMPKAHLDRDSEKTSFKLAWKFAHFACLLLHPSAPPRLVTACSTRVNHQPNLTHCAHRSRAERAAARAAMHSWAACHGPCKNTQGPAKTNAPQPAATAQQKMAQESLPPQRSHGAHTHGAPRTHRAKIWLGISAPATYSPHKDSAMTRRTRTHPHAWHPGTPVLSQTER
jgi:hypothetical protein